MTDPRVLVHPQPHVLRVAGHMVTVRGATAGEWIEALCADHFPTHVFGRFAGSGDMEPVYLAMAKGEVSLIDLTNAAREALAAAAGLSWWKAARLVGWAAGGAPAELWGVLAVRGIDADRMTLAGWCAAVWAVVNEGRDTVGREKVAFSFNVPPAGEFDPAAWAMEPVPGMDGP